MIPLPAGGQFDVQLLIDHIRASGRDYIIEGKQRDIRGIHRKPHSLDYWIRQNFARTPNTMQYQDSVRDALVATGLFEFVHKGLEGPGTGRLCNGLRLVQN